MPGEKFDADVAVIGAGAAGLAAFDALVSAGTAAILFEARERIGGRILDAYPPGWPLPVALGAEFIHGSPPELAGAEAAATAVDGEAWAASEVGPRRLESEDDGSGAEAVFALMGEIRPPAPDISFSNFLATCSNLPASACERARNFVEGFEAADPDRIGVYSLNRERRVSAENGEAKSGEPKRPRGGYGSLLAQLSGGLRLSPTDNVMLGCRVETVRWRPGAVEVISNSARRWRVRRAIVTLPLSLLQHGLLGTSGSVRFEPAIEAKRPALTRLVMGGARRITLRLREPVWASARGALGENLAGMGFLFGGEADLRFPVWWTAPGSTSGAAQITGWSAGRRAGPFAGVSPQAVEAQALADLGHLLGITVDELAEQLLGSHSHDWQTDPFSLGAYSYATVGGLDAPGELAAPLEKTLFFAGEATENTGEHATVQGGIRSGRRAAAEAMGRA